MKSHPVVLNVPTLMVWLNVAQVMVGQEPLKPLYDEPVVNPVSAENKA